MKKNNLIIIIAILIVGAGAFFVGMKYQETRRSSAFGQSGQDHRQFQGGQGGNRAGFRPVSGEIISQDDTSITVKLQDGSSKIIILSDKSVISKASTGAKSDLKVGEKVTVYGTQNSDGSITSQTISIGGNMFRGGFDSTQSASPKP